LSGKGGHVEASGCFDELREGVGRRTDAAARVGREEHRELGSRLGQ
jgi:hypothetical protein